MRKNGPWTIKSSEVKYRSPWVEVTEDSVIRPDGKDSVYTTVSFGEAGAHVLPLDPEGNAYLLKEFAYGVGDTMITVVAGKVDEGEDVLTAAKRELREEAGIEARRWTPLGHANPLTSSVRLMNHMFIAQDLAFVERALEPSEQIEVYKVPFIQAVAMVTEGEITDEIACLLILKAKLFLETKI